MTLPRKVNPEGSHHSGAKDRTTKGGNVGGSLWGSGRSSLTKEVRGGNCSSGY